MNQDANIDGSEIEVKHEKQFTPPPATSKVRLGQIFQECSIMPSTYVQYYKVLNYNWRTVWLAPIGAIKASDVILPDPSHCTGPAMARQYNLTCFGDPIVQMRRGFVAIGLHGINS